MPDQDVTLLDAGGLGGGNANALALLLQLAPVPARPADNGNAQLIGNIHGGENIGAVAAGTDGHENILRLGNGQELAGKHLFITVVIAYRADG